MALVLYLYNQQLNKDTIMKTPLVLIIAALVLSVISNINAQQKVNRNFQNNLFLTSKRHGPVVITNNTSFINPSDRVYNRIPFLVEKRHGAVTIVNRNSSVNQASNNLVLDRNPFLAEKRHGAVYYRSAKSTSENRKPVIERNLFLRQKRHQ